MADCLLGDYYPLTPYSLTDDCWMAWQFDRPEQGDGVVQVFRRTESIYESARLRLRGLDPAARYGITNLDEGKEKTFRGEELLKQGLPIQIGEQPGSALIKYRKL